MLIIAQYSWEKLKILLTSLLLSKIKWIFLNGFFFFVFLFFRAAPATYRGSQARSSFKAVAAHLRQSHSNAGFEPRLRPTLQLRTMPDP